MYLIYMGMAMQIVQSVITASLRVNLPSAL